MVSKTVTPFFPLHVFYDGSCSVCAHEIEHYKRQDNECRLVLVDISSPTFDPALFNISLMEFMYQLHVIDKSGRVFRGVDAFLAIWQAFPTSKVLGFYRLSLSLPFVRVLAKIMYRCFATLRGYLPKQHCGGSNCSLPSHSTLTQRNRREG